MNAETIDEQPMKLPVRAAASFRVADWMMFILALAVTLGVFLRHTEESAMVYRLGSQPPLSVWTRLALGHLMSSFGLIFGLSRLFHTIRDRSGPVSFGAWLWSVIGIYVPVYVLSSVTWALINTIVRPSLSGGSGTGVPVAVTIDRVSLMTFNQACFDQLAWLLVAIWFATAALRGIGRPSGVGEFEPVEVQKQDLSIAVFTALVVFATVFQRVMESTGN